MIADTIAVPSAATAGPASTRAADPADATPAAKWTAYAYAGGVTAALAHFLLGLPVQVSDSLGDILKLSASWSDLLYAQATQPGFLRPFHWGLLKLVHDVSGGDYFAWFRGTHVVQVALLVALYLSLIRPRTWTDAVALPLGLGVLVGLHTFAGTVREAFPINLYLTVVICCLAAAALVLGRYRWWNDVAILVLFVVAALTLETGLLVWVIAIGGAITGARGIGRPGLLALTALLVGYFYLRFGLLDVGSPGLMERSSGFGFAILEPSELTERFGANPMVFYAYNVATSAVSVLLSEPAAGVFHVVGAFRAGAVPPIMVVNVVSSVGLLLVLIAFIRSRRRAWRTWTLGRDDRLVLLAGMVLVANAAISFPYTKDVIMSPAGAFLAVAAFGSVRHVLGSMPPISAKPMAAAIVVAAAVFGTSWALRVVLLHETLRQATVAERMDWAYIDGSIAKGDVQVPPTERSMSVVRTLQHDALVAHPAPPPLRLPVARLTESAD